MEQQGTRLKIVACTRSDWKDVYNILVEKTPDLQVPLTGAFEMQNINVKLKEFGEKYLKCFVKVLQKKYDAMPETTKSLYEFPTDRNVSQAGTITGFIYRLFEVAEKKTPGVIFDRNLADELGAVQGFAEKSMNSPSFGHLKLRICDADQKCVFQRMCEDLGSDLENALKPPFTGKPSLSLPIGKEMTVFDAFCGLASKTWHTVIGHLTASLSTRWGNLPEKTREAFQRPSKETDLKAAEYVLITAFNGMLIAGKGEDIEDGKTLKEGEMKRQREDISGY